MLGFAALQERGLKNVGSCACRSEREAARCVLGERWEEGMTGGATGSPSPRRGGAVRAAVRPPRTPRSAASPALRVDARPPAQLREHNHNRRYNLNLPLTFYGGGLNIKISVSQIREGLSVKDRGTGAKGEKETGRDANQGNMLLPPG